MTAQADRPKAKAIVLFSGGLDSSLACEVLLRAGVGGRVVRPLSPKLLPPTIPEQEGLISRDDLLDIQGRSRKRQMALARGTKMFPVARVSHVMVARFRFRRRWPVEIGRRAA